MRAFEPSDLEVFFQLNSHPDVMRHIRPVKNRMECVAFLEENIHFYQPQSILGRYHVSERTAGLFVGTFSFLYMQGEEEIHLGYALMPYAHGKGYATELVQEGLRYYFRHTNRSAVYAITTPENLASQKVLLKAGFSLCPQQLSGNEGKDIYWFTRSNLTEPPPKHQSAS